MMCHLIWWVYITRVISTRVISGNNLQVLSRKLFVVKHESGSLGHR
jgi:hypothetical protein